MRERRVSGSEFKAFRRCKRSWWLAYLRGLQWPRVATGPLPLGSLTHLGMETLYEHPGHLEAALSAIKDFAEKMLDVAEDKEAWMKQADHAQNFTIGYAHWLEETGADQRYEHVASEEEVEMPLVEIDEVQWILIGKLDRRVRDRMTNQIRFMDFKSVQSFDQIIKDAPRNEQFPTYEMLLRHNHPGERTAGGIWRMIRKVQRSRDGDGHYFMDYEASYNERFLESVRLRYAAMAYEMHEIAEQMEGETGDRDDHKGLVPPTPDFRCDWDCDFKLVCDMFDDGSRVEDAVSDFYVVGDPYARYRLLGRQETE